MRQIASGCGQGDLHLIQIRQCVSPVEVIQLIDERCSFRQIIRYQDIIGCNFALVDHRNREGHRIAGFHQHALIRAQRFVQGKVEAFGCDRGDIMVVIVFGRVVAVTADLVILGQGIIIRIRVVLRIDVFLFVQVIIEGL